MDARARARQPLPFVLPDFTRHSWVSERAQSVWEPRFARIRQAWLDIEWRSVAAGVRDCALLWVAPAALPPLVAGWEASRLSAIQLQVARSPTAGPADATSGLVCVLVGALDRIERLRHAWDARDDETVGALLGYPPCCRAFFREVWVGRRCLDTTWAMAENSARGDPEAASVRIELPEESPPHANILWRWLGVRAVPHLPCRFDCPATIALGERLREVGERAGHAEALEWTNEILSWPVEWSALHGIAEVKSPLMKVAARTDATAGKCVVQWAGAGYPAEGAVGLHFPYQKPKRKMFTRSRSYQLGISHGAQRAAGAEWLHADNGFATAEAMERLHRPVVELARAGLAGVSGNVLDLGCGNGALLGKLCAGRDDLVPFGVDTNGAAIEHARRLLPRHDGNFVQGDLFEPERWSAGGRRYGLALLMLGRLVEAPEDRARRLLDNLEASCSRILVYLYPDWGEQDLATIARRFGLEVKQARDGAVAWLKNEEVPVPSDEVGA